MNNTTARRVVTTVAALLIFTFIGYQIYRVNFAKQVTEEALYKTVSDKVQATGYAIRKESILTNSLGGVLQYEIEDGGKVSAGGTVANAFSSVANAGARDQIKALEKEKEGLLKLQNPGESYAGNVESVSQQVNLCLVTLLAAGKNGENTLEEKQNLQYLLNEKQLLSGGSTDFSARVSAIDAELSSLHGAGNGTALGAVTSESSGYFTSRIDGFENLFDYGRVSTLTVEDLTKEQLPAAIPENAVGKVTQNFNWYFACTVPAREVDSMKVENTVKISFPFASSAAVPAEIVAVNQMDKDSDAAVILKCSRMDQDLINIRHETAEITVNQYSGIQVSQKAIRFEELTREVTLEDGTKKTETQKVPGVYVMYGSEIQFRQIVQIYGDGAYIYCDPEPDPSLLFTDETVKQYDQVIIEGADLYNGKVIG